MKKLAKAALERERELSRAAADEERQRRALEDQLKEREREAREARAAQGALVRRRATRRRAAETAGRVVRALACAGERRVGNAGRGAARARFEPLERVWPCPAGR